MTTPEETKKALELPCGDSVDIVETSNGREYWYDGAPLWNPQKVHRVALQGVKHLGGEIIEMLEAKQIEQIEEIVLEKLND